MKNIEELKGRIKKFNVEPNLMGGYVCIGYGESSGEWLENYFNVDVFYMHNQKAIKGYGNDSYSLYYITEKFARENGLMPSKTLEEIAQEAENFIQQWKKNSSHVLTHDGGGPHSYSFHNPPTVEIFTREKALNSSPIVREWARKHSSANFVVVIHWGGIHYVPFDLKVIALVPSVKKVVLNDSYTAEVHKDKVVVGCQTIELKAIRELNNALKQLGVTLD